MIARDRLTFLPREEAVVPPSGIIEHLRDRWWITDNEGRLVFFDGASPQCNASKSFVERLRDKLYPWAKVEFFPSVFRRINLRDYC